MPRSTYWQEPDIIFSREDLPQADKHREECSMTTIGFSMGYIMEELEKDWRSWRSLQPYRKNNIDQENPQNSQGLNNQTKIIHGGTHGSNSIWSRGLPCRVSMGREAIGPVKAWYPSVMPGSWGGCGWLWAGTHSLDRRRRKDEIGGFWRGKRKRYNFSNANKENIQ